MFLKILTALGQPNFEIFTQFCLLQKMDCKWRRQVVPGHHHNGNQAAWWPHTMSSICGRRFGCNFNGGLFDLAVWRVRGMTGVEDGPTRYPACGFILAPDWHIWSISYRFWVIQLAPKAFLPARRPDPDTMTNTVLEAIASSRGKNAQDAKAKRESWIRLTPDPEIQIWNMLDFKSSPYFQPDLGPYLDLIHHYRESGKSSANQPSAISRAHSTVWLKSRW